MQTEKRCPSYDVYYLMVTIIYDEIINGYTTKRTCSGFSCPMPASMAEGEEDPMWAC